MCRAELSTSPLFASGMVLQRDMPDPVWGWASAGQTVQVQFAGKTYTGKSDSTGKWQVVLAPSPANGTPQTMIIQTADGSDKQTLTDILIGDVWLCSGQSNMGYNTGGLIDAKELLGHAANPQLRLFHVDARSAQEPEPKFLRGSMGGMLPDEKAALDAYGLRWVPANAETVASFSGVAFVFGDDLQHQQKVPVGLIEAAFGGTTGQQWTPRNAMLADDDLKTLVTGFKGYVTDGRYPGGLYNGSIAPLQPMGFRGLIWYQGESNSDTYDQAVQYRKLLPALISGWRADWKRDFPVMLVQVSAYHAADPLPVDAPLPWLREAQSKAAVNLKRVGMVSAIDLGLMDNWHPRNKSILGHRLAVAVEQMMKDPTSAVMGPHLQGVQMAGNNAIVTFAGAASGLKVQKVVTNGGKTTVPADKLSGFALSDSDGVFHWANAKIANGNQVEVSSPDVPHPVFVRYGWAAFPLCNLYSGDGFPAIPFRTDKLGPGASTAK